MQSKRKRKNRILSLSNLSYSPILVIKNLGISFITSFIFFYFIFFPSLSLKLIKLNQESNFDKLKFRNFHCFFFFFLCFSSFMTFFFFFAYKVVACLITQVKSLSTALGSEQGTFLLKARMLPVRLNHFISLWLLTFISYKYGIVFHSHAIGQRNI